MSNYRVRLQFSRPFSVRIFDEIKKLIKQYTTYHEHLLHFLNPIFSHVHHTMLDQIAPWNIQLTTGGVAVYVVEELDKLRILNLGEGLIRSHNPRGQ